jgi:hypothetical protein
MGIQEQCMAQALLIAMAVGNLFNSQLLDAPEGRFFVVLAGVLLASAKTKTAVTLKPQSP